MCRRLRRVFRVRRGRRTGARGISRPFAPRVKNHYRYVRVPESFILENCLARRAINTLYAVHTRVFVRPKNTIEIVFKHSRYYARRPFCVLLSSQISFTVSVFWLANPSVDTNLIKFSNTHAHCTSYGEWKKPIARRVWCRNYFKRRTTIEITNNVYRVNIRPPAYIFRRRFDCDARKTTFLAKRLRKSITRPRL